MQLMDFQMTIAGNGAIDEEAQQLFLNFVKALQAKSFTVTMANINQSLPRAQA